MTNERSSPDVMTGDPPQDEPPIVRGRLGQRASKCADESWAIQLASDRAMKPDERMIRALDLDEETEEILAWLGRAKR